MSMQGTLPFTLLVLDLFSHYHTRCLSLFFTLRLSTCAFLHYQAHSRLFSHCQARCLSSLTLSGSYSLTIRLTACLLSLAGSLHIYSHSHPDSLPLYSHSHSGLLPISLSLRLAACLFSPSLRLAACLFSHYQAYCLSILKLSGLHLYILKLSGLLPVYSHTIRLTACLFSHYQARCLSILTLMLLSICFHTQCC